MTGIASRAIRLIVVLAATAIECGGGSDGNQFEDAVTAYFAPPVSLP